MSRPRLPNHPDFDPVVLAAVEHEWLLHAASEKLHTRWVAVYNQEGRMVNVTRQLEGVRTSTADKAGPMDPETNLFEYYAKPHLRILTVEDMAEAIYKHWLDRPDRQAIDPFYRMINRTYDGPRKEDATWLVRQIKEKTKVRNDGVLRNRLPGGTQSDLLVASSASSAAQILHNRRPGAAVRSFPTATSASPVAQTFQSHPIPQTSRHRVGSVPNRTDRSFHTPVSTAPATAAPKVYAAPVNTNITSNRSNAAPPRNATTPPPDRHAVQSSAAPMFPSGSANVTSSRTTREVSSSTSRHRLEVIDITTLERKTHNRSANTIPKKTARPAQRSIPGPVSKSTTDNYNGGGPVRPAGQNGFDSADSLDGDVDTTDIPLRKPSAPAQRATYQPGSKGKETGRHVDNSGPFTHLDRKLPAFTQSFDEDASQSFERYATPSFDRYATQDFERGAAMTDPAPKPLHHEEIWSLKSPRRRSTNNLNNSFFSQPDSPTSTSSNNNIALAPAPTSVPPPAHSSLPPKPPTMAPTRPTRTAPKGPRGRNRGRPYQSRDSNNRGNYRGESKISKTAAATDSTSHLLANARPEPAMYTPEWQLRQRASVPGCNHNNRFKEEKNTVHDKITSAMNKAKRASAAAAASGLGGPPLSAPADAGGDGLTGAARRSPSGLGPPLDPAADMGMGVDMGTGNRSFANSSSSRDHRGGSSSSFNPNPPQSSSSYHYHQPNEDGVTFFRSSRGAVGVMGVGMGVSVGRDLSHGLGHEWPSTSSSRSGRLDDEDGGSGSGSGVYGSGSGSGGGRGFGGGSGFPSAFGNTNTDTNTNTNTAAAATSTSPPPPPPPPPRGPAAAFHQTHHQHHRPSRARARGRIQSQSQSQSRRPHRSRSQAHPRPHSSPFATGSGTTTGTGTGTEQVVAAVADTYRPTHDYDHEEEYELSE